MINVDFFVQDSTGELDRSMPAAQLSNLANGIRVVTLDTGGSRSDVAVVQIRLISGWAQDSDLPGVAQFTSAMLTRGSGGRTLEELAEELDSLGATIGIGAAGQATNGSTKSLREDADRVLGLITNALLEPDFPEDQVEIVRSQMLSGLRQARNSTRAEADHLMRKTIYPEGHPYHRRSVGTEESLGQIHRQNLIEFHARTYTPVDAIVSVAGGLSHEEAVDLVDRHLGGWLGETPDVHVDDVSPPDAATRVERTLAGKTQADLAMGIPCITRYDPDYYALNVANLVLGRFGLMGRLGESVRERQGMAYYAYSALEAGKTVGVWNAKAGVAPDNVDRAIESILVEIRKFREEGPTEREFSDAIGSILGSMPLGLETSGSMAGIATDLVYYDLGLDYLQRYRSIIQGLTPERITAAAQDHIDPDRLVTAIVAPDAP